MQLAVAEVAAEVVAAEVAEVAEAAEVAAVLEEGLAEPLRAAVTLPRLLRFLSTNATSMYWRWRCPERFKSARGKQRACIAAYSVVRHAVRFFSARRRRVKLNAFNAEGKRVVVEMAAAAE